MTKDKGRFITPKDFANILHKLRATVNQNTLELVTSALQAASSMGGRRDGKIDYRVFLRGELARLVEEYCHRPDVDTTASDSCMSKNSTQVTSTSTQNTTDHGEEEALDCHQAPSTMAGENGQLADDYKEEALRQFSALVAQCRASGVVLSWELAERGESVVSVIMGCSTTLGK